MNPDPKRRSRRHAGSAIALSLLALVTFIAPTAGAAVLGPRLATVELINTKGSERDEPTAAPFMALTTFGAAGERPRHLLKQRLDEGPDVFPLPFSGASWSGDGELIAFLGARGKREGVYVANADGRHPRLLAGTSGGRDPVISPDGTLLAFSKSRTRFPRPTPKGISGGIYTSTTTWLVGIEGGKPRRLTSWRNGLGYVPGSFSPEGSQLALTKRDDRLDGPRVVLMDLTNGSVSDLVQLGEEPAISPDGTRVAFVGYANPTRIEAEENRDYDIGELYAIGIDGTQMRRLTRNKDRIESSPSWDPSAQRLAYVDVEADTSFVPGLGLLFPTGNAIKAMNADGSCRETVRSSPKAALYGAAWQPGPERGAGPIAC